MQKFKEINFARVIRHQTFWFRRPRSSSRQCLIMLRWSTLLIVLLWWQSNDKPSPIDEDLTKPRLLFSPAAIRVIVIGSNLLTYDANTVLVKGIKRCILVAKQSLDANADSGAKKTHFSRWKKILWIIALLLEYPSQSRIKIELMTKLVITSQLTWKHRVDGLNILKQINMQNAYIFVNLKFKVIPQVTEFQSVILVSHYSHLQSFTDII